MDHSGGLWRQRDAGNKLALEEGFYDADEEEFLRAEVTFLVGADCHVFVEHGSWFATDVDTGKSWSLHAASGPRCVVAEEL
jgi:hypothetical protein